MAQDLLPDFCVHQFYVLVSFLSDFSYSSHAAEQIVNFLMHDHILID